MFCQNNFQKYKKFREKYVFFSYDGFDYHINDNKLTVNFHFSIDDKLFFHTQTTFHLNFNIYKKKNKYTETFLFYIGMVELISYWKTTCCPLVIIKPFLLNNEQIAWWKKLWFNGLGEFFYTNSINNNMDDFMNVKCITTDKMPENIEFKPEKNSVIVPVGGGKDSVVSLEFFKSQNIHVTPMLVNPRKAMYDTLEIAGICTKNAFIVEREISPLLLKLNEEGYLNGHTPFSSLLAFQSLLLSYFSDIADIALSNESSADEPNVPNTDINHQYSKSLEFENDFRYYIRKFVSPEFNYYSILRPLSDIHIAYIFSCFPDYFSCFRSCNAGSKENIWCGKCPKCLYTAVVLLPYIDYEKLKQIFGYDMLDNSELLNIFRQLTGMEPVKPFECVGKPSETIIALSYCINNKFKDKKLPALLEYFRQSEKHSTVADDAFKSLLFNISGNNYNIRTDLFEQLVNFCVNCNPSQFKIS